MILKRRARRPIRRGQSEQQKMVQSFPLRKVISYYGMAARMGGFPGGLRINLECGHHIDHFNPRWNEGISEVMSARLTARKSIRCWECYEDAQAKALADKEAAE